MNRFNRPGPNRHASMQETHEARLAAPRWAAALRAPPRTFFPAPRSAAPWLPKWENGADGNDIRGRLAGLRGGDFGSAAGSLGGGRLLEHAEANREEGEERSDSSQQLL